MIVRQQSRHIRTCCISCGLGTDVVIDLTLSVSLCFLCVEQAHALMQDHARKNMSPEEFRAWLNAANERWWKEFGEACTPPTP